MHYKHQKGRQRSSFQPHNECIHAKVPFSSRIVEVTTDDDAFDGLVLTRGRRHRHSNLSKRTTVRIRVPPSTPVTSDRQDASLPGRLPRGRLLLVLQLAARGFQCVQTQRGSRAEYHSLRTPCVFYVPGRFRYFTCSEMLYLHHIQVRPAVSIRHQ